MNRITPLILAVALFMEMMDSTVIATSLPAIAADIGTQPIALKLAMTSYLVALAIFIPISGWIADRYEARRVFRWAIFVFMVGSVACAISSNLAEFVGARFFQGMGGAMMTPLARLVLVRSTQKKDLVSAMAWMTVPALMGPVAGPPIGGFLTTFFSWHWIFLINIPIGIIGIIASAIYLPEVPRGITRPLDLRGFVLTGTAFAGILFGLSVISLPALPPSFGLTACVIGAISLSAYIWHAKRTEFPLLDLNIFKNPTFRTAILGGAITRIGVGAMPFLLPLMLQLGFGLTPFESGLITLFGAVGAVFAKFFARRLYAKFGFRRPMMVAAIISAILTMSFGTFDVSTPAWIFIIILLVLGVVRSVFFTGTNAMSFADTSEDMIGQATAISSVGTHITLALGVALAGGVLEFTTSRSGHAISIADFHTAFLTVGAVSLLAITPFFFLSSEAGSAVSGHNARSNARLKRRKTARIGKV